MIDHGNKFIQVKISKCASTTIQRSLNRDFSKTMNDYPVTPEEWDIQRFNGSWIPHFHLLDQINIIEKGLFQDSKKYFKFTFVRNPWDRLVSHYFFATRFKDGIHPLTKKPLPQQMLYKLSFKEFIMNLEEIKMNTNWVLEQTLGQAIHLKKLLDSKGFCNNCYDWISDENGKMLPIDFIGKFENLEEDYNKLTKLINCPVLPNQLPKENPSKHQHYTTYYDKDMIQIVNKLFEKDIETFKYKFEN